MGALIHSAKEQGNKSVRGTTLHSVPAPFYRLDWLSWATAPPPSPHLVTIQKKAMWSEQLIYLAPPQQNKHPRDQVDNEVSVKGRWQRRWAGPWDVCSAKVGARYSSAGRPASFEELQNKQLRQENPVVYPWGIISQLPAHSHTLDNFKSFKAKSPNFSYVFRGKILMSLSPIKTCLKSLP